MGKYIEDGKLDLMGSPIGYGKVGKAAAFLGDGGVILCGVGTLFSAAAFEIAGQGSDGILLSLLEGALYSVLTLFSQRSAEIKKVPSLGEKYKQETHRINIKPETKKPLNKEIEALVEEGLRFCNKRILRNGVGLLLFSGLCSFAFTNPLLSDGCLLLSSVCGNKLVQTVRRQGQWNKIEKGDWTIERYVRPTKVKERKFSALSNPAQG